MKPFNFVSLLAISQAASAHYIFQVLTVGDTFQSVGAIRQPLSIDPVLDVTSTDVRCNVQPTPANETVEVKPGELVGFQLNPINIPPYQNVAARKLAKRDLSIFHPGPAAFYLGKAPTTAAEWDGSGERWFKVYEWGPTYDSLFFEDLNLRRINATIPENTPPGEYLLRIEQIGLLIPGEPQFYMSCAQIRVTGNGAGTPSPLVSIPGHIDPNDPNILVDIFAPEFNENKDYVVPGPAVWSG